jgi:magnesium-transporting ATPase (P-type)
MKPADSLMRLRPLARWMLYGTIALLVVSGVGWIVVHYASDIDDLSRLSTETAMLKFHGAAAFAMLIAVGAMSAHHVRRGWLLARNRRSGSIVIAILVILIVTGYALYYLVNDATRAPISSAHWLFGIALAPMLIAHLTMGRRTTESRHTHARRIKRKATARSSAK